MDMKFNAKYSIGQLVIAYNDCGSMVGRIESLSVDFKNYVDVYGHVRYKIRDARGHDIYNEIDIFPDMASLEKFINRKS